MIAGVDLHLVICLVFSFLFVVIRTLTFTDWIDLFLCSAPVKSRYFLNQSWVSNASISATLMGIVLPLVTRETLTDLQTLHHLYGFILIFASYVYSYEKVLLFFVADFLTISSHVGSTSALWWGIFIFQYNFSGAARWFLLVTLPISAIGILVRSWNTVKSSMTVLERELHETELQKDRILVTEWIHC